VDRASRAGLLFRTALPAFAIALTGAATPGPLLALVIAQVLAGGFAAVLFILLGHAVLELGFVGLFALGFSRLLRGRAVQAALSLVGGAVLLWMGFDLFRHAAEVSLALAGGSAMPWWVLVGAGAGVSLANPYFTGWWATVGAGQIAALQLRKKHEFLVFWIGHEMGDAAWYVLVAAMLTAGRMMLTDAAYRGLLYGCSLVMAALGLGFIAAGVRRLRARADSAACP